MDKDTTFWTVLFRCQRLYSAHVADAKIRGAWRIREPLSYSCVRMVSCYAMMRENFMMSRVLES
jgi:hypothetical protein